MSCVWVLCLSLFATSVLADVPPKWCAKNATVCAAVTALNVTCVSMKGSSCAVDVANGDADLASASADALVKGVDKLKIVLVENYKNPHDDFARYWSIAVVKQDTAFTFKQLKGQKSCHTGVGKTAGWKIPVGYLLRTGVMPFVKDQYESVAEFFSASCVPGIKDHWNGSKLCSLCAKGSVNNTCSGKNAYAGHNGAFKCMAKNDGRVAFVKHTTTADVIAEGGFGVAGDYKLLCTNGKTKATSEYASCNIDKRPSNTIVTKKSATSEDIKKYIKIIEAVTIQKLIDGELVHKDTKELLKPKEKTTKEYLGNYYDDIMALSGVGISGSSTLVVSLLLHVLGVFALFLVF